MSRTQNGGVIGKLRTTTAANATGIWDVNSYTFSKNAGLWPVPALPGFTPAYMSLLANAVGTTYYVDAVSGSDSNSGLTPSSPFATWGKFATTAGSSAATVMVSEGTYTLTSTSVGDGYGEAAMFDNGGQKLIICAPGKVKFQFTSNAGTRDAYFFRFSNPATRVYGGIFRRNNNGRSGSYEVAFITNLTTSFNLNKIYNCVLEETNANGAWSLQYANAGYSGDTDIVNCTFRSSTNGAASYSGSAQLRLIDCAGMNVGSTNATITNYYTGTPNATTYAVTGATSQGVYFGTYAWPAP